MNAISRATEKEESNHFLVDRQKGEKGGRPLRRSEKKEGKRTNRSPPCYSHGKRRGERKEQIAET